MDKKNIIIAVLAGFVILGSLWGSIGNRNAKVLRHELEQAKEKVASVEVVSSQSHDAVLTKTAELQKILQLKDEQLVKARKELVSLRKANKSLEAKLSERDAAVQKLVAQKDQLAAKAESDASLKLAAARKKMAMLADAVKSKDEQIAKTRQAAAKQLAGLQEKISALKDELKQKDEQFSKKMSMAVTGQAEALQKKNADLQEALKQKNEQIAKLHETMEKMSKPARPAAEKAAETAPRKSALIMGKNPETAPQAQTSEYSDLAAAKAQIVGLEKIIEEKNANVEEISRELDRVKINMDVLLSKISDQQDTLQEVQEENSELVKELAAKNEECADLQEQLQKAPQ